MVCLIVTADAPMPPEVQILAEGNWSYAAISPDGKWVAGRRRFGPERGEKDGHIEISIWNVADPQRAPDRAAGGERETRRDAGSATNGAVMRPSRTADLRDYDCNPISATICFPSDGNGQLVVFTREPNPNAPAVRRPAAKDQLAETDEAQDAKAAGRKVSQIQRQVTLFLDPETLEEKARWVHNRRGAENLDTSFVLIFRRQRPQFNSGMMESCFSMMPQEKNMDVFRSKRGAAANPRRVGSGMPESVGRTATSV